MFGHLLGAPMVVNHVHGIPNIPWGPNNQQITDVTCLLSYMGGPKTPIGSPVLQGPKKGAYMQCFVALLGPAPDCARWPSSIEVMLHDCKYETAEGLVNWNLKESSTLPDLSGTTEMSSAQYSYEEPMSTFQMHFDSSCSTQNYDYHQQNMLMLQRPERAGSIQECWEQNSTFRSSLNTPGACQEWLGIVWRGCASSCQELRVAGRVRSNWPLQERCQGS